MKKKHKYLKAKAASGRKSKSLTVVLCCVAALLLILVGVMLFLISRTEEPEPTEPSQTETTAPAPSETETVPPTTEETVPVETEPVMLEHMAKLYEENPEIIGWIKVDDTLIDYPVMYTPEDEDKYIHLSFDGQYNYGGVPFVDKDYVADPQSQNMIIFGHNMKDGSQFAHIMKYQSETFWKDHRYFQFTTLYEEQTYEIIAAFKDRLYKKTEDVFKFYQFVDPETEEEFNEGIEYFKSKTPYEIEATAEYGDTLITLVCCAYHEQNGRFVVVARLVTDEEPAPASDVTE